MESSANHNGTHPKSIRDPRSEEAHQVDVLLARQLRSRCGAAILVFKHQIVSDV